MSQDESETPGQMWMMTDKAFALGIHHDGHDGIFKKHFWVIKYGNPELPSAYEHGQGFLGVVDTSGSVPGKTITVKLPSVDNPDEHRLHTFTCLPIEDHRHNRTHSKKARKKRPRSFPEILVKNDEDLKRLGVTYEKFREREREMIKEYGKHYSHVLRYALCVPYRISQNLKGNYAFSASSDDYGPEDLNNVETTNLVQPGLPFSPSMHDLRDADDTRSEAASSVAGSVTSTASKNRPKHSKTAAKAKKRTLMDAEIIEEHKMADVVSETAGPSRPRPQAPAFYAPADPSASSGSWTQIHEMPMDCDTEAAESEAPEMDIDPPGTTYDV
jgi:hypothetical protein